MDNHPLMSDVNIMLLGSTGSGKSASGNTILGKVEKPFKEDFSPASVTRVCNSDQTVVDGQTTTVIDTVGLSDTSVKITDTQTQIEKVLQSTNIDVFPLVIKLGETFTVKKREAVKWMQDNFGAKFLEHSIVLFTHGDQLHVSIETYLSKSKTLRSVVDQCSGGFHVFNNTVEDRSQVNELLKKINKLKEKNENMKYTEQDYAEAQKQLLRKKCAAGAVAGGAAGAAAGGAAGAAAGAAAAKVGVIALTAGLGAVGGAVLLAVAAGVGVYCLARKYKCINVEAKNKSV